MLRCGWLQKARQKREQILTSRRERRRMVQPGCCCASGGCGMWRIWSYWKNCGGKSEKFEGFDCLLPCSANLLQVRPF